MVWCDLLVNYKRRANSNSHPRHSVTLGIKSVEGIQPPNTHAAPQHTDLPNDTKKKTVEEQTSTQRDTTHDSKWCGISDVHTSGRKIHTSILRVQRVPGHDPLNWPAIPLAMRAICTHSRWRRRQPIHTKFVPAIERPMLFATTY